MKIGIIEAGMPPGNLEAMFGRFDAMVRELLGIGHCYQTYRAYEGVLPHKVEEQDAYVITGSMAGVHDDAKWIADLSVFLQTARGSAKLVGICFGHQIIAHAFGGKVGRATSGWGIGLHAYRVREPLHGAESHEAMMAPVFHQDQVIALPSGARVLAASDFTPFAVLTYEDQSAISFQCHPEFSTAFARALVDLIDAPTLSEESRTAARTSLEKGNDELRFAGLIEDFLAGKDHQAISR
ncbi:glutamine amidotransferase-related protein [Agrobacterium tumefaciens]|uniref:glutamine amidotransferase-related protein n=1 Tax=Agrobacterium tumefaciens TaxID=358 RepID=UPI001572DF72|nr:type 1 glutamine amidotransferase [Agrobacterium tumefaciens]NTD11300.1 type 1 glutamine amidotransferase [Agrobacterium tumefaciens]